MAGKLIEPKVITDLKVLFPDEETVQNPAVNEGEKFNRKGYEPMPVS